MVRVRARVIPMAEFGLEELGFCLKDVEEGFSLWYRKVRLALCNFIRVWHLVD